jgi:microcystin-dependent protein
MRIEDLTFEVRDANLKRVGQLLPDDLVGWASVDIFKNVGSWSITLRADLPLALQLAAPGAGIIVTHVDAGVLFSGPTDNVGVISSSGEPLGLITITGVDDSVILGEHLAFPTPSTADVTAQTSAYDIAANMPASTAMYGYVARNMLPGIAPAQRAVPNLTFAPDTELGYLAYKSARFDILGELLSQIAVVDGLGFRVKQSGLTLEFSVYEPTDRTREIRMDVANDTLSSVSYGYGVHGASHVIVAGQGEGAERQFVEMTTAESLSAETLWGRRKEVFKDERNTGVVAELEQAGLEILAESGLTITSVEVIPSSDETMQPFTDWGLGDLVTVVVGGQEVSAIVSSLALTVSADGVRVMATVGQPTGISYDALIARKAASNAKRVNALDRKEAPASAPGTPTGVISEFAGASAPAGYLLCNGSAVSRATYSDLFATIGTTFGAGNGSSTFNVPNHAGRVAAGKGSGTFATLGATGGAETVALSAAQTPSHTHTYSGTTSWLGDHSHAGSVPYKISGGPAQVNGEGIVGGPASLNYGYYNAMGTFYTTPAGGHNHTFSGTTSAVGSNQAHENLAPFIVMNFIIKT